VRFDETWIHPGQLAVTAALAASTAGLSGEVVEIGTWQGWSAIPIANAVAPSVLHVVDHWLGDEHIAPELTARDNYSIFLDNMAEGTAGNYQVWKMDWREFAGQWDKPVRFLHLDAAHTADEVSDNLAAIIPHAVPGAIFCGDDFSWPSVQAGVARQFEEINATGSLWWVKI
jgi:hypothetical protein